MWDISLGFSGYPSDFWGSWCASFTSTIIAISLQGLPVDEIFVDFLAGWLKEPSEGFECASFVNLVYFLPCAYRPFGINVPMQRNVADE
jgi:hypothetical protein